MTVHTLRAPPTPVEDPTGDLASSLPTLVTDADLRAAVAVYVAQQPRLIRIAYRILGSTVEAEDVVQEVWVRWQRTDRARVNNPPAFLAAATTRLAINVLHAAPTRREAAVTPWLEDLADSAHPGTGPETTAERAEAAALVLHLLLERLTPSERAVYLLREGFDYPYCKIAAVLPVSVTNARQLASRARRRLPCPQRQPVSSQAHRRLVRAFRAADQTGDFAGLEALLAADIALKDTRVSSDEQTIATLVLALCAGASRSPGRRDAGRGAKGGASRAAA